MTVKKSAGQIKKKFWTSAANRNILETMVQILTVG